MIHQSGTAGKGRVPVDHSQLPSPLQYYSTQFPEAKLTGRRAVLRCCFHADGNPSLSISFETGAFHCFACQSSGGDIIDFHRLKYGLGFRDCLKELTAGAYTAAPAVGSMPKSRPNAQHSEKWLADLQARLWRESRVIVPGDPVALYMEHRGLKLSHYPDCLRFHESLEYRDHNGKKTGEYPGMLAKVTASDGSVATLHRTYLTSAGHKALVNEVKKLMPPICQGGTRGAAIRLASAGKQLGIAEGIETALACNLATCIPTWAAVSASLMKLVEVPLEVEQIIIFGDNDRSLAGQTSARQLAERLYQQGRRVKLLLPPRAGEDWLDVYLQEVSDGNN